MPAHQLDESIQLEAVRLYNTYGAATTALARKYAAAQQLLNGA